MTAKTTLAIVLLAAVGATGAMANPSIKAGANQGIEDSESTDVTREKRLSVDKSTSGRNSNARTTEHSREKSQESSQSQRQSNERRNSQSFSTEVNLNSLLLQRFVAHYENVDENRLSSNMPEAVKYFATCKPLKYEKWDYPVVGEVGEIGRRGVVPLRVVVNRRFQPDENPGNIILMDAGMPVVSRFAQCRMTASYWLAAVGRNLAGASAKNEAAVAAMVDAEFERMDLSGKFQELRQKARDEWRNNAICTTHAKTLLASQSANLDCGVFQLSGDKYYVSRRQTLSPEAIDGVSFKIALSSDENSSMANERSSSVSERSSMANRASATSESASEVRNSASLSRDRKSSSQGKNTTSRSAGSDIDASLKQ